VKRGERKTLTFFATRPPRPAGPLTHTHASMNDYGYPAAAGGGGGKNKNYEPFR
jgi:hypothetical protein